MTSVPPRWSKCNLRLTYTHWSLTTIQNRHSHSQFSFHAYPASCPLYMYRKFQVACPKTQYWISNWPITFSKTAQFAKCDWSIHISYCIFVDNQLEIYGNVPRPGTPDLEHDWVTMVTCCLCTHCMMPSMLLPQVLWIVWSRESVLTSWTQIGQSWPDIPLYWATS